jgi:hypothetical protein
MNNLKQKTVAVAVALVLSAASISQAVPTLYVTDGITSVTITDNGVGDANPSIGAVAYLPLANTFAGWTVILSSGITKPILGSVTNPQLDLNWQITRESASAGNLSVYFSENGFNLAGPSQFQNSSGGTLGDSGATTALISTYYNGANGAFDVNNLGTQLTTHLFVGPGAFAGNDAGAAPADPSVAFTIGLVVNQGAGTVSSGDIHLRLTSVPEGGSMVTFLGTALLALGAFAARRKA